MQFAFCSLQRTLRKWIVMAYNGFVSAILSNENRVLKTFPASNAS